MKLKWMDLIREGEGAGAGGQGEPPAGQQPPPGGQQAQPNDDPPPPQKQAGSIYDDLGVEEPGKEGSTSWPADWREQFVSGIEDATEREKALNVMKRYASPSEVAKANLSMRQRVSSGEYTRQLPPDATEEQVKEWRAEQGLPETPDGYELPVTLDGKLEDMDDNAKAVYQGWQKQFHDLNVKPEIATQLVEYANTIVEAQMEAQAEADAKRAEMSEDTLRTDWGPDFRNNLALAKGVLSKSLGEEGMKSFLDARLPDGTLMKHSPEIAKFLVDAARGSGLTSSYEGGAAVGEQDLMAKKAEIEGLLKTNMAEYKKREPEYRTTLEKLEKLGKL